jgi:thioester reductase-like protein
MMYLTGDQGRVVDNGDMVVLGRMDGDSQVKLRGIRIELEDISNSIMKTSKGLVTEAVVIVRGEGASQFLVAFVVLAKEYDTTASQPLLDRLLKELPLPTYMRPTVTIALEALPVTGRGKLDTHALADYPLPEVNQTDDNGEEELTEMESRLKAVWREVLSEVDANLAIKRSSDFFSVGGNSLLLTQLRIRIRSVFNVDIPLPELFQSSTLETLAARLEGSRKGRVIDWDDETRVSEDLVPSALSARPLAKKDGPFVVALTGATGFLGSGLLRHLEANPNVSRIHCLALRGNRTLPTSTSKVATHAGDLSLPYLGMSASEAADVFSEVDFIIHNGATVSHLKSYQSLRGPNVASTKELIRLSALQGRRTPIHYVSTAGIATLTGLPSHPEVTVSTHAPVTDGSNGYIASKWASERFLERLNERVEGGWPVYIHRPSSITSNKDPASVPASDITHNTLRFSQLLRKIPDFSGGMGAFDFIDVETISSQIIECMLTSDGKEGEKGEVTYKHQSGEHVVPFENLREFLGHTEEDPVGVLRMDEWVKAAVEAGMDSLVGDFLAATKGNIQMPLLVKGIGKGMNA